MGIRKFTVPINFILFQLCWFGSVLGAANGFGWLGLLLVLVTIPPQIFWLTKKHKEEVLFILLCGVLGFILETLLIRGEVYIPVGQGNLQVCPPWMVALWLNFGMLVSLSLSWLRRKYMLAAVLGGIAGPLAWWGGEKLAALTVAPDFFQGYLPLAVLWALALPCLIYLHARFTSQ